MGLSEDFALDALNVALMLSTIRPAVNDDLEASDRILQAHHFQGDNGVK